MVPCAPETMRSDVGDLRRDDPSLPPGASARLQARRLWPARGRSWSGVRALAFSPDGKALRVTGRNREVASFAVATGAPLEGSAEPPGEPDGSVRSPDGALVASCEPDGLHVRCAATRAEIWTARGRRLEREPQVAFSPAGDVVAFAAFGLEVLRLEAATGRPLGAIEEHTAPLAFAPDGSLLAARVHGAAGSAVDVLDSATGRVLRSIAGAPTAIALSPDGRRLALGGRGCSLRLLHARTGKEAVAPSSPVRHLAYSGDGRRLSALREDGAVRLWERAAGAGREGRLVRGKRAAVTAIAFSPSADAVAAGCADGSIDWISAATGRRRRLVQPVGPGSLDAVAWAPDGRSVAAAGAGAVRLLDARSGKEVRRLEHAKVHDQVPGGEDLVTGGYETIERAAKVLDVVFSPGGAALAAGAEDAVRLWDPATGAELRKVCPCRPDISVRLAFSPDGRVLAVGSDWEIGLWDAGVGDAQGLTGLLGEAARLLAIRTVASIQDIAWSPDGARIAAACAKGNLVLHDAITGDERARLEGHEGDVRAVAFSPDGREIASADDDTNVLVWAVPPR